jgi:hypothetical protein
MGLTRRFALIGREKIQKSENRGLEQIEGSINTDQSFARTFFS